MVASLWQESFGAARRGRPAACVPAGGGDPLPVRGPACPGPLRRGGGVFSHISLPVTGLRAPGSAIFGARASRELRRVDRPERLFGVFSAAGAIPAGRGSDAEPVRPGWAAGGGRRAGDLLQGDATPGKSLGKQRSVDRNGAAGGGREGALEPGAHPRGAPGAGVAGPRRSGPLMRGSPRPGWRQERARPHRSPRGQRARLGSCARDAAPAGSGPAAVAAGEALWAPESREGAR